MEYKWGWWQEKSLKEKVERAVSSLKMALMESEELRRRLQGKPLRVWASLVALAINENPQRVKEILVKGHFVYVDEEGRTWANSSSWYGKIV